MGYRERATSRPLANTSQTIRPSLTSVQFRNSIRRPPTRANSFRFAMIPSCVSGSGARTFADLLGIVGLVPRAYPAPGLVYAARRVFVAAIVQNSQVARQTKKETKFFETQVCVGEPASPLSGIRRFNQTLRHIESSRLDAFAEKKLLLAGKALHRGHQATKRNGSAPPRPRPWRARFSSLARPPSSSSFVIRHSSPNDTPLLS